MFSNHISSCSTNKKGVDLVILNSKLYYENSENTDETKQKSVANVVRYKISNNTNKKLLFFIRDLNLKNIAGLNILIKSENKLLQSNNKSIDYIVSDSCYFKVLNLMADISTKKTGDLRKLGFGVTEYTESYHSQTFIINPNESWTFEALLTLPVIDEGNLYLDRVPYKIQLDSSYSNKLFLEYQVSPKTIEYLSKSQIEELQKNNVEIYLGKLVSNEVSLEPVGDL